MRKLGLGSIFAATIAASVFSAAPQAQAVTFLWSFSGPGVSGGGAMQATFQGGVTYLLTAISGTINGQAILGLSGYAGGDQLVFYPNPPNVVVNGNGFGFSVGNGSISYNIYEDFGLYPLPSPYHCGAPYCLIGPGDTLTGGAGDPVIALETLTLTAAPEPATWAMMLVGFAGLGFAAYRRKTAAVAV
jgi:hypothetical protein